jgi:hypothetical protein
MFKKIEKNKFWQNKIWNVFKISVNEAVIYYDKIIYEAKVSFLRKIHSLKWSLSNLLSYGSIKSAMKIKKHQ